MRFGNLFLAAVFCGSVLPLAAHSQIVSSKPTNPGTTSETRGPGSAILTVVNVGAAPVTIGSFGTFGHINTTGNLKWTIFNNTANSAPLFATAPVAALGGNTDFWNDSPAFSFTLNANTTYQLGVISDQAFTYTYDVPGTTVTAGGLTLPAGTNGNASNFANPILGGSGSVLNSFRAFAPPPAAATPEPGSIALLVSGGLAGVAFLRRKRTRK